MQSVTRGGVAVEVGGDFPTVGDSAPDFTLTNAELEEVSLADFSGRCKVLNIIPSVDTKTCAMSTRKFNEYASGLDNTVVLVVSADLPFAQSRFCGAEGLDRVVTLSSFRHPEFRENYGVALAERFHGRTVRPRGDRAGRAGHGRARRTGQRDQERTRLRCSADGPEGVKGKRREG